MPASPLPRHSGFRRNQRSLPGVSMAESWGTMPASPLSRHSGFGRNPHSLPGVSMAESWGTMPASPLSRHSGFGRNPRSLPGVSMAESWGTMPASPLSRHSGFGRNPRSLPGVSMAESWGTMPASPLPRHSGFRRNPRSLPGVRIAASRRKSILYDGKRLTDCHEWASATGGVARRPELPAVPEGFCRKDDISCRQTARLTQASAPTPRLAMRCKERWLKPFAPNLAKTGNQGAKRWTTGRSAMSVILESVWCDIWTSPVPQSPNSSQDNAPMIPLNPV